VKGVLPAAGDLRQRVRVDRRHDGTDDTLFGDQTSYGDDTPHAGEPLDDGYGNSEGDWLTLVEERPARVAPRRGDEAVIAARLQGVAPYDVWLRTDPDTLAITEGDRVVDLDAGFVLAVRYVGNLDERGRFLLLQCEAGRGSD